MCVLCVSRVSLMCVLCVSYVCLMRVLCVSYVCLMCVWCVSHVCLMCVWCVSDVSLMCVWCVSHVCLMCVSCVSDVCLMCVWCVCYVCLMCGLLRGPRRHFSLKTTENNTHPRRSPYITHTHPLSEKKIWVCQKNTYVCDICGPLLPAPAALTRIYRALLWI